MNLIKYLPRGIREVHDILKRLRPFSERTCPICNYHGLFRNSGRPPRIDALCPSCHSLERHRLFWLWYLQNNDKIRPPILHFAPEETLEKQFRNRYGATLDSYKTCDLYNKADLKIDIEQISLEDGSFSSVICNHVLEHINDRKALAEIHRILSKGGIFIVSTPIIEGWDRTYENPAIVDPAARDLHFGQRDHVRYYGSDLRDRLSEAGFTFEEITAQGEDVVTYSLLRGEKFFICRKVSSKS